MFLDPNQVTFRDNPIRSMNTLTSEHTQDFLIITSLNGKDKNALLFIVIKWALTCTPILEFSS